MSPAMKIQSQNHRWRSTSQAHPFRGPTALHGLYLSPQQWFRMLGFKSYVIYATLNWRKNLSQNV